MTKAQLEAKVAAVLNDIDSDYTLSDEDYVDLMDTISADAEARADAKREEMRARGEDV